MWTWRYFLQNRLVCRRIAIETQVWIQKGGVPLLRMALSVFSAYASSIAAA
jgi:hypothetical protein